MWVSEGASKYLRHQRRSIFSGGPYRLEDCLRIVHSTTPVEEFGIEFGSQYFKFSQLSMRK